MNGDLVVIHNLQVSSPPVPPSPPRASPGTPRCARASLGSAPRGFPTRVPSPLRDSGPMVEDETTTTLTQGEQSYLDVPRLRRRADPNPYYRKAKKLKKVVA